MLNCIIKIETFFRIDVIKTINMEDKLLGNNKKIGPPVLEIDIQELKEKCAGATRIGFKLESGIKQKDLVHRAHAQIQKSGMTATIANRIEDYGKDGKPRGWLVDQHGAHFVLETESDMCDAIRSVIENNR